MYLYFLIKSQINNFSNNILHIQNAVLFGISLYSLYISINYNLLCPDGINPDMDADLKCNGKINSVIMPMNNLQYFIKIHAIIDIFFVKLDVQIHHLCIIGCAFFDWYLKTNPIDRFVVYPLLRTEISSIFYILTYYIPKSSYAYYINSIMFYVCYLKLRIIDVYNLLIYDSFAINRVIIKYSLNNHLLSIILYVSIYGLYILNMYWFLIITKMFYKKLLGATFINTHKMCEYICSYIYFLNVPVAIYVYSLNKRKQNILDVSGVFLLSIASYLYHHKIFDNITNGKIKEYTVIEDNNLEYFLNDYACIHIRSLLAVITGYYNSPFFYEVVFVCGLFQVLCFYFGIINVIQLLQNDKNVKTNFYKIHNIFIFSPIGLDVIMVALNASSTNVSIPFLFINIAIALLFAVNPFYNLTHVAFHILLIMQTYYISQINIAAQ